MSKVNAVIIIRRILYLHGGNSNQAKLQRLMNDDLVPFLFHLLSFIFGQSLPFDDSMFKCG